MKTGLHQRNTFEIFEAVAFQPSTNPKIFYLEYGTEPPESINDEGGF
jgi:hypothetical protein